MWCVAFPLLFLFTIVCAEPWYWPKDSINSGTITMGNETIEYSGNIRCEKWTAGVLSIPTHFEDREWIRSWIDMPHVFLIGGNADDIRAEQYTRQDILHFNIEENYRVSLEKKVRAFFHIVLKHCPQTQYVLKIDDDSWVNTTLYRSEVELAESPVYYGMLRVNARPIRRTGSKYYNPTYKREYYPNYAAGVAYVLDRQAIQKSLEHIHISLTHFEDVNTGLLSEAANIVPIQTSNPMTANGVKQTQLSSMSTEQELSTLGDTLFLWASALGMSRKYNLLHCQQFMSATWALESIWKSGTPICVPQAYRILRPTVNKTYHDFTPAVAAARVGIHENRSFIALRIAGDFASYKYFEESEAEIRRVPFHENIQIATKQYYRTKIPTARIYIGMYIDRSPLMETRNFPSRNYFEESMAYYRSVYGDDIMFVVGSNNMSWCRQQTYFRKNTHVMDETLPIQFVLSVLSKSNHSIMSIGSLSWWASWMANGDTIYDPHEFKNRAVFKEDDYYPPKWKRFPLPTKPVEKKMVGITYRPNAARAIGDHTLFMYDTIRRTKKYTPVLILEVDEVNETTMYQHETYRTRTQWNYSNLSVAIRSCYPIDKQIRNKAPGAKVVLFNHGPSYFNVHEQLKNNGRVTQIEKAWPIDIIWPAPHYVWQGEFLKELMQAQSVEPAPYVWEPRALEQRYSGFRYKNGTNKRIGIYETNRGLYKTSVVPMLIVEHAHKKTLLEHAESYGLGKLGSDAFHNNVIRHFKAPWVTENSMVQIPKHWAEQRIGIVVSYSLRCGLNNLGFEVIHAGMALVHNSEHLPKGCGYYYPGENVTAGAEALRRAIETHNDIEAERQRNICLPPFSTSNPDNIAWYERLLDKATQDVELKPI